MYRLAIVAALCGFIVLPIDAFDEGPSVLRNRGVFDCFMHVLREGRYGYVANERAAFVIEDQEGTIRCVDWRDQHEFKMASWSGPFPPGTVAIAHTHPYWSPDASPDDQLQAVRRNLPIFILTANAANVVHANGHTENLAHGSDWTQFQGGTLVQSDARKSELPVRTVRSRSCAW